MADDWDQMTDQELVLLLQDNPGDVVESPMSLEELADFKAACEAITEDDAENTPRLELLPDVLRMFAEKTRMPDDHNDPNACWEWTGRPDPDGYGKVSAGATVNGVGTHRIVCEFIHGVQSGKMQASHSCHNRICIRPSHLTWDTPAGNTAASIRDGRKLGRSLSDDEVRRMRAMRKADPKLSAQSLANHFGTSQQNAWGILAGLRRPDVQ